MTNLRLIKDEETKVAELHKVVSAMRMVAITQMRQFTNKKQNYSDSVNLWRSAISSIDPHLISSDFKHDIHLIMSCDQRFCKNFTNLVEAHLKQCYFSEGSKIMLFGKRSRRALDRRQLNVEITNYKVITGMPDCESIALILMQSRANVFMHYFESEQSAYIVKRIWPVKYTGENSNLIDYDLTTLIRLYLTSEVYFAYVQTALKESTERSLTTSEATENAEQSANELRKLYNKLRQAKITQEVTAGE